MCAVVRCLLLFRLLAVLRLCIRSRCPSVVGLSACLSFVGLSVCLCVCPFVSLSVRWRRQCLSCPVLVPADYLVAIPRAVSKLCRVQAYLRQAVCGAQAFVSALPFATDELRVGEVFDCSHSCAKLSTPSVTRVRLGIRFVYTVYPERHPYATELT